MSGIASGHMGLALCGSVLAEPTNLDRSMGFGREVLANHGQPCISTGHWQGGWFCEGFPRIVGRKAGSGHSAGVPVAPARKGAWTSSVHHFFFDMRCSLLFGFLFLGPFAVGGWAQTDWFVNGSAPGPGSGTVLDPYQSIQFAIEQPSTRNGDRVLVAPGTYQEHLDFLGKAITVAGNGGEDLPVVAGNATGPVVIFQNDEGPSSILQDIELTGGGIVFGMSRGGGAKVVNASPTFSGVLFRGNNAHLGAGAMVEGGAPDFGTVLSRITWVGPELACM